MKKTAILTTIAVALLLIMASCKKETETDAMNLPVVTFKTGKSPILSGYSNSNGRIYWPYSYKDTSLTDPDSIVIGIKAWKAEPADVLKTMTVIKSTTIPNTATTRDTFSIPIPTAMQDTFTYDYIYSVIPPPNTKINYEFRITNRDGLVGKKSLTSNSL